VCSIAFAAELPAAWRSWRYSRAIEGSSPIRAPAELPLSWDVFARCEAHCADFRLIDDRGQEVPFELAFERSESSIQTHAPRVIENSFVEGQYTQVIADVGENAPPFDRVRVQTFEPDFILWAELALSDDARTWRIVEARSPISRFRSRAIEGAQTIPFEGLPSRYVRVRIFEPSKPFPVNGLELLYKKSHEPRRTALPAILSPDRSNDPSESRWRANLGTVDFPVSEAAFTTDEAEFYRAVRISSSEDGTQWIFRASGEIYRYHQGEKLRELLRVDFPEIADARLWRVDVVNGNDQPLANAGVELRAAPRRIVFRVEPGRAYRLLYGNLAARSPQYDLSRFLDAGAPKPVYLMASLGPEELTRNYVDPRPFTERHPVTLWIALGIAIVLLGLSALRALRGRENGRAC